MNFDCESICNEKDFIMALAKFGLVKGPHCATEDATASLVKCLSSLRNSEDVFNDIDDLKQGSSRIQAEARSIYNQCLDIEYGLQKSLLTDNCCPNISLLSSLSYLYDADLFVVCGFLVMRCLRIEDEHRREYDVLKFKFSRRSSNKLVIGMVGFGLFHCIEQPQADSPIWESLSRRSILVDRDRLSANEEYSDHEEDDADDRDVDDQLADNADRNLEIQRIPQSQPRISEDVDLITMRTFINRCLSFDSNGANLSPAAYGVSERISIHLTSIQDFGADPIRRLDQTIDIDGFFGVFDWRKSHVFRANVKLLASPIKSCPRDYKSLEKLLKDCHFRSGSRMLMYKVATCTANFGVVDVFYSCFVQNESGTVNNVHIENAIARAFAYAKEAKCVDSHGVLIHQGCTSHGFRSNTDAYRPVENGNNQQTFDSHRYACFTYHFGRAAVRGLSNFGVRIIDDFCYVQAVGMKFVLHSQSINGILHCVTEISDLFDLNKKHSQYDLSFSTVAQVADTERKVFTNIGIFINTDFI